MDITGLLVMKVQHLFSSTGQWIAFRIGKYIFNTEGEWIGWLPWQDLDVVDLNGDYLGTIYPENRFYRKLFFKPLRGHPGYPGYPKTPDYPGYPGYQRLSPLPPVVEDLKELQAV